MCIRDRAIDTPQIAASMLKDRASIKALPGSAETAFGDEVTWRNTNALLKQGGPYYYQGCLGGKTGFTTPAGHCLAVAARREGRTILAVVMKAPTSEERFADAVKLLDYGFAH